MFYKRYLLFAGDYYYPTAAWGDFQGDFETKGEALEAFHSSPNWCSAEYAAANPRESWHDWGYIVDLETGENEHIEVKDD